VIELPDGINPDDIGQWLYGGVCLYRGSDGTYTPAIMDRVLTRDNGSLYARIRIVEDNFEAPLNVDPYTLYAHWPLCGSVNVAAYQCALHVERLPARQYKRTFNGRQVKFHLPRAWDVRKRVGQSGYSILQNVNRDTVLALFRATYPESTEAAFEMLGNGWLSVAVNPRVIIAGDDLGKRMVYYRGQLAATMTGEFLSPIADLTTCKIIDRVLERRYAWTVEL